jgi:hypothetical protein
VSVLTPSGWVGGVVDGWQLHCRAGLGRVTTMCSAEREGGAESLAGTAVPVFSRPMPDTSIVHCLPPPTSLQHD